MEFTQLKKDLTKLGLQITKNDDCICIFKNNIVCSISERRVGVFSTDYDDFNKLPMTIKEDVIKIASDYALTRLAQRHIQKYYLKHNYLTNASGYAYLNVSDDFKKISLGTKRNHPYKKTRVLFSDNEILMIKQKLNTSLDDFTVIPFDQEQSLYHIS